MRQRDEVSQLHSFDRRRQVVFLANWFRQDFGHKGYTALFNFAYNHDRGRVPGDRATLNVAYAGFHGDGKWGKLNVDHAFYWAFGRDRFNRLAGREQTVNAQMAAFEGSVDRDWTRWRGFVLLRVGRRRFKRRPRDRLRHDSGQPELRGRAVPVLDAADDSGGRRGRDSQEQVLAPAEPAQQVQRPLELRQPGAPALERRRRLPRHAEAEGGDEPLIHEVRARGSAATDNRRRAAWTAASGRT